MKQAPASYWTVPKVRTACRQCRSAEPLVSLSKPFEFDDRAWGRRFCLLDGPVTVLQSFGVLLLIASGAALAGDWTQPVQIETGLIQGFLNQDQDVVSFLGVPYAAAPVGELRWREPQPPPKWEGVRKADAFGPSCPQLKAGTLTPADHTSEDCLYLNVWVPVKTTEKDIPILFFVHGGCYQFGSGDFDGEGMAKKGIILVTANQRLGNFCSMGHPELTRESPLHSCANYGSLDLIAALKWIQRNIAAFGGDPGKVTISGQSTGASNVHFLTTSPLAEGLFRGAIAISFPYEFLMKPDAVGNMHQAEQAGLKLAKTLEDLRKIPASELLKGGGGPTIGSPVFPKSYPDALEAELVSDVPTLTGMTLDDLYDPSKYYTDLNFYHKRVARQWPDKKDTILALYPAKTNEEAREMWKRLGNEVALAHIFHWAKTRAKTAKTPVYTYMFTQVQPMLPERGAYHGSDLDYEFNNVRGKEKGWREEDRKVAEQVSSYWVNFVKSGNPNGAGLPEWKAFDPNDPSTMYLGKDSGFHPISNSQESWELLHERK